MIFYTYVKRFPLLSFFHLTREHADLLSYRCDESVEKDFYAQKILKADRT